MGGKQFPRLVELDFRKADVTDKNLKDVGGNISAIDVSGCGFVTSAGVKSLVNKPGAPLRVFRQLTGDSSKTMKVSEATLKSLKRATALSELSLTVPMKFAPALQNLSGHQTLKSMKLHLGGMGWNDNDASVELPYVLPNLEYLELETSSYTTFKWPNQGVGNFVKYQYPNLKRFVIVDKQHQMFRQPGTLMRSFCVAIQQRFACTVEVRSVGKTAPYDPKWTPFPAAPSDIDKTELPLIFSS